MTVLLGIARVMRMGVVAAVLAAGSLCAWGEGAPEVGRPAPALVVQELNGHVFDLASLRGKVVVVNFWATWCSPCRAEMPQLDSFYRHYHSQGVELLGLSIDNLDDRAEVGKVMQKFSYPAALMATAKVNGFGSPMAVPMTYVIDAAGMVHERLLPGKTAITEDSLGRVVRPLLQRAKQAQGAKQAQAPAPMAAKE